MYRWSLIVLAFASVVHAQDAPTRTEIRLEVEARPAPKPALLYRLLPDLREIGPGTALQQYMKCFMEQNHFYHSKEMVEEREKFVTMPLQALPLEKVRDYGGKALRNADLGARMERMEWQILQDLRRDGVYTLLPEIQKLRSLAQALRVRMRGEIAQKKYDEAIETAKTLLKMGHQLGEHPTLIGNLVGFAFISIAAQHLEEMLQQPGCPNLYWAFASLPEPLVALRSGAEGERLMIALTVDLLRRDIAESETTIDKVTADIEKVLDGMQMQYGLADGKASGAKPDLPAPVKEPEVKFSVYLAKQAKDGKAVDAARKQLIEDGAKKDIVVKMPARQVLYLREADEMKRENDEILKWLVCAYHKAAPHYARMAKPTGPLSLLVSNTRKVHLAQARTEQRLKMLQILEAIRLHAAANNKQLPARLDDIDVPIPVDPMTGKAFRYSVDKGTATLAGTPPQGHEKQAAFNVVYQIKIAK